jgi:hypothetical protein
MVLTLPMRRRCVILSGCLILGYRIATDRVRHTRAIRLSHWFLMVSHSVDARSKRQRTTRRNGIHSTCTPPVMRHEPLQGTEAPAVSTSISAQAWFGYPGWLVGNLSLSTLRLIA